LKAPKSIWSRLSSMNSCQFVIRILLVAVVASNPKSKSVAQSASNINSPHDDVIVTKLTQPIYPPLARQTRITGDVEVNIEIRRDGSVRSGVVVSGHPLLKQAALDSAQQSQFECRNCSDSDVPVHLTYTFQLATCDGYCAPPAANQTTQSYPRVIQSENHVTLIDRPPCICDPAGVQEVRKVRSLKCLYLWRCGFPHLVAYE
jgi:TonB family protein